MEKRITDFLNVGDVVVLRVADEPHPKTGRIGFEPLFSDVDQNIMALYSDADEQSEDPDEYWDEYFKSVRFFNPTNFGFELRPGEDWQAKIEKITIMPAGKLTRDGRRYVFIDVCVLGREEQVEHEFAEIVNHWITRTYSGRTAISVKRESAKLTIREYRAEIPCHFQRYWGEMEELALTVEEIRVEDKIVRQKVIGCMVRDTYERRRQEKMETVRHPFKGSLDPKVAKKLAPPAFGELPQIPPGIKVPHNPKIFY